MRRVTHFVIVDSDSTKWQDLYFFTRKDPDDGFRYRGFTDKQISQRSLASMVYRCSVLRVQVEPEINEDQSLWLSDNMDVFVARKEDPQNDPNKKHVYV